MTSILPRSNLCSCTLKVFPFQAIKTRMKTLHCTMSYCRVGCSISKRPLVVTTGSTMIFSCRYYLEYPKIPFKQLLEHNVLHSQQQEFAPGSIYRSLSSQRGICSKWRHQSLRNTNIARGNMDPRVEFISQVLIQILINFQFQNLD